MDASVGLTFSLQLFQRYQRNGILQAKIRHVPGIQGVCTAYVYLTAGAVTACYLENKQGQRLPFPIDDLCRIDNERGPFEWIFQPHQSSSRPQASSPLSPQPSPAPSSSPSALDPLIPRIVAPLRWEQFNHWTPEQQLLLQNVWQAIDGRRTIQDMKTALPYSPQIINDIIQILLSLHVIVLVP